MEKVFGEKSFEVLATNSKGITRHAIGASVKAITAESEKDHYHSQAILYLAKKNSVEFVEIKFKDGLQQIDTANGLVIYNETGSSLIQSDPVIL